MNVSALQPNYTAPNYVNDTVEVFRTCPEYIDQRGGQEITVSDSAWFPSISQLELRVDGVVAVPHRLDALFMIVRASTRLVSARRRFRDAVVRHRWATTTLGVAASRWPRSAR